MKRTLLIGIAAFIAGIVALGMVLGLLRSESETVNAGEVAQRVEQADSDLIAAIKPGTTIHVRAEKYRQGAPHEYTIEETWVYFGDAQEQGAASYNEIRDAKTGERLSFSQSEGNEFVYYDGDGNVISRTSFDIDLRALQTRLLDTQLTVLGVINEEAAVPDKQLDGKPVFVLDRRYEDASTIVRTYVETEEYRTLRWEKIRDGVIVETKDTPVFEILPGNQMPTAN